MKSRNFSSPRPVSTLLLGTGNAQKIQHYKNFLRDLKVRIATAGELDLPEPHEDGRTFEENALFKARHYFNLTSMPTLADDGGFEIPALNNFPGVHSKRFAGLDMNDEEIIVGILDRMKGLRGEQRMARFKIVIALQLSESETHLAAGQIEGIVPEQPYQKRMPHFPYRSLLFITKLKKWFYEVMEAEEEALGYRKAALEELKKYL